MSVEDTSGNPDHAGVVIPPPLIFLVPFLIGFLLNRRSPWPISVDPEPLVIAGIASVSIGIVLGVSAVTTFRRQGTTILPARRPTRAVVDHGPYRFTRNPMYVAMGLAYIGGALVLTSIWPLMLLPFVVVAIDRYVIAREERYLRRKFGEEYAAYMRRVRRWL